MSFRSEIRSRVFASLPLKTLFWMGNNASVAARGKLSLPRSRNGSRHKDKSADESLAYIEKVFAEYKRYGRIERFHGQVTELGPGDNAGVAMLIRGDGAETVDLVDRYHVERDDNRQASIYSALAERHGLHALRRGERWDERRIDGVTWHTNDAAEGFLGQAATRAPGDAYDFILSRAVLEHVMDPLLVIEAGLDSLRPGGKMVHMIDFRDHGYYSREHAELTFLRVPTRLWPALVRGSGGPNRVLLHRYREHLDALASRHAIRYELLVSHLVDVGLIEPYRELERIDAPSLARARALVERERDGFAAEFRDVATDDLAVSSVCLVVEKTA